ncbi:alpha/beta hydrolase [Cellulophaga baltica]|uniref:Pimeloyl-ACP methyl ester carboxylesterase n=1 Tax=Cellulophaga baltica TaxID=76594 RepID=A0A1G7M465_9FLAO|nr:alpha/beta hydrolase [Cellulophaga baltica]SDF56441.1 Pimeloyl-ACP methyl ester carboxylesterase [Cellulophaga baltica]
MKVTKKIILSILFLIVYNSFNYAQQNDDKLVVVDGKKITYKTINLENRKDGSPILVFESGLGGGTFDPILTFLPSNISSIQYARNGIGQSELDLEITSDSQVAERLHNLLLTLNIKPPYLLVGHSIGGPYIRLFASKFPDEVCGLVFSDPTDFMLTAEEDEKARIKSKSGTGYRETSLLIQKMMSENNGFSQGARNDATRALKANELGYFHEYQSLPELNNNIATTVIISYNKNIEQPDKELNETLNLGINFKPFWREYDNLRIQHYSDLIKDNNNSMLILLPKYSHGIYYQNPELVTKLIIENYNSYKVNKE